MNRIGFATVSCVTVAFLFKATLRQFRKKPVKAFNALPEFILLNVATFQFSNFSKNSTSDMTLSVSTIMTVSVIESTRVNVFLKVIVTVPSKGQFLP